MLKKYIFVFLISMVPVVELRGAIPVAVGMDLDKVLSFVIAIIGNMIPVPFIYLFAKKFLNWGKDKKYIGKACLFFIKKGKKAGKKLEEKTGIGLYIGLLIFVGIPLPGTGAWTGTLAASFLNIDFKKSIIAIMLGVLLAGVIMMMLSFGVFKVIF